MSKQVRKTNQIEVAALVKELSAQPTTLVLLVGIPASGKSTFSREFVSNGFVRISMDSIREELYGSESALGKPAEVRALMYDRLTKAFSEGHNVLIDNTNCVRSARDELSKKAKSAGCVNVVLVIMKTPLKVCMQRNRARSRVVPEAALRRMHASLTGEGCPKPDEGKLIWVRPGPDAEHVLVSD